MEDERKTGRQKRGQLFVWCQHYMRYFTKECEDLPEIYNVRLLNLKVLMSMHILEQRFSASLDSRHPSDNTSS